MARARALRTNATDAERLLWRHLRDRRLAGFKFRRQHPVGPFFADFACLEAWLVVEVDGGQHFEAQALVADEQRSAFLRQAGYSVLRFNNREVLTQTTSVLDVIHRALLARGGCPHPSPLPQAGEGAMQGIASLAADAQGNRSKAPVFPPLSLAGEGWGEGGPHIA